MKVTIITTCLNRAPFIKDAMQSVIEQDYTDIEYIIVDGNSSDGSKEIISEFIAEHNNNDEWRKKHSDFSFKFICEPDNSLYEALNKGISVATGDIIGMVHSDDYLYDSHTIRDVVSFFNKTNADFVYANGLYVDSDNTQKIVRNWISSPYARWKIRWAWLPLHTTCYVTRKAMNEIGPYNEKYKIASDTDFLIRALFEHRYKIEYLKRYVVTMRMGGVSTSCKRLGIMWKEDVEIFRDHGFPPVTSKIIKMLRKVPQFITARLLPNKILENKWHKR